MCVVVHVTFFVVAAVALATLVTGLVVVSPTDAVAPATKDKISKTTINYFFAISSLQFCMLKLRNNKLINLRGVSTKRNRYKFLQLLKSKLN